MTSDLPVGRWAALLQATSCEVVSSWSSRSADLWLLRCDDGRHVVARYEPGVALEDLWQRHRLYRSLHRMLEDASSSVRCPDSFAIDAETGTHLMEFAPGEQAEKALTGYLARGEAEAAHRVVVAAGDALAIFHAALRQGSGDGGGDSLVRPLFGDFALYNLHLSGQEVWLLDLPARPRDGHLAADLASLSFHLRRTIARTVPRRDARHLSKTSTQLALHVYATASGTDPGSLRRDVARFEARRALNMARKRHRAGRPGSAAQYLLWAVVALGGRPFTPDPRHL